MVIYYRLKISLVTEGQRSGEQMNPHWIPQRKVQPCHASEIWACDKSLVQLKLLVTGFHPHLLFFSSLDLKEGLQSHLYNVVFHIVCCAACHISVHRGSVLENS